jgi:hypothetical protein
MRKSLQNGELDAARNARAPKMLDILASYVAIVLGPIR